MIRFEVAPEATWRDRSMEELRAASNHRVLAFDIGDSIRLYAQRADDEGRFWIHGRTLLAEQLMSFESAEAYPVLQRPGIARRVAELTQGLVWRAQPGYLDRVGQK